MVGDEILALMQVFVKRSLQPSEVFDVPSMFSLQHHLHYFATGADVEHFFAQLEQYKEKVGWATSEVGAIDVCELRQDAVIATVTWNRFKADGSLLEIGRVTYTLIKKPEGWRILTAIQHRPETGLDHILRA